MLALDALVRIEDGAFAHVVLPAMLRAADLADRDRAFATELVYGTRARRSAGSTTCSPACVKRPLRRLDPPVRAALRLGAYQLLARHAAARRGGVDRRRGRRALHRAPVGS